MMLAGWRVEARYARIAAKRWHASIEGKLAIYGVLFFAVTTLAGGVIDRLIPVPYAPDAISSRVIALRSPCKAAGETYLFGVKIWLKTREAEGDRLFCRDLAKGEWVN